MMFAYQTTHPSRPGRKADRPDKAAQQSWEIESLEAFDYLRISTNDHDAGLDRVITVDSVRSVVKKFLAGGGSIAKKELSIPGVGKLISCRDKVGQVFTFLEEECPVNPQRIHFG